MNGLFNTAINIVKMNKQTRKIFIDKVEVVIFNFILYFIIGWLLSNDRKYKILFLKLE